jgi:hypothetical protein
LSLKAADKGFQHWVLFNGWDGDAPRVLDPADPERTWTTGELLSYWDGAAILLGKEPQRSVAAVAGSVSWWGSAALFAGALLLAGGLLLRGRSVSVPAAWLVFGAASGLGAWAWELAAGQELLRPAELHGIVAAEYAPPPVPTATLDELKSAVHEQSALIVDARLEGDFKGAACPAPRACRSARCIPSGPSESPGGTSKSR